MICATGAVVYLLMIYYPPDGRLMRVETACSQRECLSTKRQIIATAPTSSTIHRSDWAHNVVCSRK